MARNKFDIDETLEAPFSFKNLVRALVYIKRHTKKMVTAFILSVLSAVIGLASPMILGATVDKAVPAKDYRLLIILAISLALTIVISVSLSVARSKIMLVVSQDIIFDIRKDIFEHLQRLPFKYYDDRPQGKILIRVVNYPNNVSDMLSNGLINFILELINIAIILVYMLLTSPSLTLVIVAGVPIFTVITFILKPHQRRAWQKISNKNSNLNAYLSESIDGTNITQVFTREEENARIFDRLSTDAKKAWLSAQYTGNLIWVTVDNLSTIVVGCMYLIGVIFLSGSISFGVLLTMGGYAWRFWQPISSISNIYNQFINSIAYLERIFELLDEKVDIDDKQGAITMPPISGDVIFKDVTFSYDNKVNILENVSFEVKAGESIALVGPTGAGKTTIVNLISRFYDINAGKILLDGYSVSDVTLHSLRSQMGIMLQDSFIFSGTIEDNIKYGNLNATHEEVVNACKTVYAHDFITAMDNGYETEVNERGSRLSQGQKQLLSFARTLIADPKILILDEATSSIDAKTELMLQQALLAMLKGRTSFIIAHRLSTIKNCDKIMYISNKGITECGSHDELLAKKGDYYNLYTSQLA